MSKIQKQNMQKRIMQEGRSMVEMLSVLVIIGLLSIAGILGFQYAMQIYKENETLNAFSVAVAGSKTANLMQDYIYSCIDDNNVAHFPCVVNPKAVISTNYEMRTKDFTTAVGSPVRIRIEDKNGYTVRIKGINKELCESIKSGFWGEFCAGVDGSEGGTRFPSGNCKSLSSIECASFFQNAKSGFGRRSQLQADIADNIKEPNVSYEQAGYNALVLYFNDAAESFDTESGDPDDNNPGGTTPGGNPGGNPDPGDGPDPDDTPDDNFYDNEEVQEQLDRCYADENNVAIDFRSKGAFSAKSKLAAVLPQGMSFSNSFICCNRKTGGTVFTVGKVADSAGGSRLQLRQGGNACQLIAGLAPSTSEVTPEEEGRWTSSLGECDEDDINRSANCCNWYCKNAGHEASYIDNGKCECGHRGKGCDFNRYTCENDCKGKWGTLNSGRPACCTWGLIANSDKVCCEEMLHGKFLKEYPRCCKGENDSPECCVNAYNGKWDSENKKCCAENDVSTPGCCEAGSVNELAFQWINGECCNHFNNYNCCENAGLGKWDAINGKCCRSSEDSKECCKLLGSGKWDEKNKKCCAENDVSTQGCCEANEHKWDSENKKCCATASDAQDSEFCCNSVGSSNWDKDNKKCCISDSDAEDSEFCCNSVSRAWDKDWNRCCARDGSDAEQSEACCKGDHGRAWDADHQKCCSTDGSDAEVSQACCEGLGSNRKWDSENNVCCKSGNESEMCCNEVNGTWVSTTAGAFGCCRSADQENLSSAACCINANKKWDENKNKCCETKQDSRSCCIQLGGRVWSDDAHKCCDRPDENEECCKAAGGNLKNGKCYKCNNQCPIPE